MMKVGDLERVMESGKLVKPKFRTDFPEAVIGKELKS